MTKILLVRHGHVEGITPERFRGRADVPLTEQGLQEAHRVARRIASAWKPMKVYASPMKRCGQTGDAIARACGIETEVIADLNDIDYGASQWKTFDEVRQADPEFFTAWLGTPHLVRFPDGESLQHLMARAANAFRLVLGRHPDHTVVLVGHDSVNRALLLQVLHQPLSAYWSLVQNPCCINEIEARGPRIQVVRMNETSHLQGGLPD